MLGYIYVIKNTVNNKMYIGQTGYTIRHRFNQHLLAARSGKFNTKLYVAMREIGIEHFYVEEVCCADIKELPELEMKYIREYNTFYNGYNSTFGGNTNLRVEDTNEIIELVLKLYKECRSISKISRDTGIGTYVINRILHNNGIETSQRFDDKAYSKENNLFGVQYKCGRMIHFKNEYIAADTLCELGLSNQDRLYLRNDILRSLDDGRSAGGYKWFRHMEEADELSQKIKNRFNSETHRIIECGYGVCKVEVIHRENKGQTYKGIYVNDEIPEDYDPKRIYGYTPTSLLILLRFFSVNKIAAYYNVSFTTMKRRLANLGLPYTKDEIAAYRKRANTDVT